MQKIVPNLWFNGNAAEAAQFYTEVFPTGRLLSTSHYPDKGLPDSQQDMAGKELAVNFEIAGLRFTGINAGPEFPITPAISFLLDFDEARGDGSPGRLNEMWSVLVDGGEVLMPLGEYARSPRYGWLRDRFGVTWQLILSNPSGDSRPIITPSLLFAGPAQNRATEAREFYMPIFSDSRTGIVAEYPEPNGPAPAGAVEFSDFTLAGQWFAAFDSYLERDYTFTEGVSLSVECADQEEIDRLWTALSDVPEAERCGWCKDRFGVSWQIVPENMGELMERPGAYQKMLSMKKLEIAKF